MSLSEFPILARVTQRVFCISASSAQSQRDFSSIGNTITDVRSRLLKLSNALNWFAGGCEQVFCDSSDVCVFYYFIICLQDDILCNYLDEQV